MSEATAPTAEATAPTAEKAAPEMNYDEGAEVTIMRGIHRGKVAKVIGVDKPNFKYNVRFADGSFAVVNAVNVKSPTEGSVTTSRLVEIVADLPEDAGMGDVIDALSKHVDGFAKAYDSLGEGDE